MADAKAKKTYPIYEHWIYKMGHSIGILTSHWTTYRLYSGLFDGMLLTQNRRLYGDHYKSKLQNKKGGTQC